MKDGKIDYIGDAEPQEDYGERYDGKHRLLMSGFYNVHSHAPMTLLRGYAENLPLQRWLGEKVFPFEDKIDDGRRTTGRSFPSRKCWRAVRFRSRICISSSTA